MDPMERQFAEWHGKLLPAFYENFQKNVTKRINKIEDIAKGHLSLKSSATFKIQINVRKEIMNEIKPEIDDKTTVSLKSCKKIPDTKKKYHTVSRNRLNRNKPQILGNYVFPKIIFDKLFNFIRGIYRYDDSCMEIMELFIDIMKEIFDSEVHYDQTKPKPVIPYNTLIKDNAFRNGMIELLRYYRVPSNEWDINKNDKFTGNGKAQKQFEKMVTAFLSIKSKNLLKTNGRSRIYIINTNHKKRNGGPTWEVPQLLNNQYSVQKSVSSYSNTSSSNECSETKSDHNDVDNGVMSGFCDNVIAQQNVDEFEVVYDNNIPPAIDNNHLYQQQIINNNGGGLVFTDHDGYDQMDGIIYDNNNQYNNGNVVNNVNNFGHFHINRSLPPPTVPNNATQHLANNPPINDVLPQPNTMNDMSNNYSGNYTSYMNNNYHVNRNTNNFNNNNNNNTHNNGNFYVNSIELRPLSVYPITQHSTPATVTILPPTQTPQQQQPQEQGYGALHGPSNFVHHLRNSPMSVARNNNNNNNVYFNYNGNGNGITNNQRLRPQISYYSQSQPNSNQYEITNNMNYQNNQNNYGNDSY